MIWSPDPVYVERRGSVVERRGSVVERRGNVVDRRGSVVDRRGSVVERRGSVVVSTSACHAGGRGSLPGPLLGYKPGSLD